MHCSFESSAFFFGLSWLSAGALLAGLLFLLVPLCFLGLILGVGLLLALAGPGFQFLDGPLHLAGELLTAGDFLGKFLAVLLIGISRFGLRQQVVDIESKLIADFHRPLVAHVLIDRRVSLQVGSVE